MAECENKKAEQAYHNFIRRHASHHYRHTYDRSVVVLVVEEHGHQTDC